MDNADDNSKNPLSCNPVITVDDVAEDLVSIITDVQKRVISKTCVRLAHYFLPDIKK